MNLRKVLIPFIVVMFTASLAFAGNTPEFDAVGCDATNYFNDAIKASVVAHNKVGADQINDFSDFTGLWCGEYFDSNAGQLRDDPCFDGYLSILTPHYTPGKHYEWQIVLQMQPESDIDLNIVDCVMKGNIPNIWEYAQQTGRYRTSRGELRFVKSANPRVTVEAYAGEYSVWGNPCDYGFILDARKIPTLGMCAMDDKRYTSKALWEEGIVLALPVNGKQNKSGEDTYTLSQGDMLRVRIDIPGNNTCYIRYGEDNVVLKYIGMVGTEYMTQAPCI
ncbi:MAG: hypothetical protein LWX55_05550 [Deltaproteobacteria bacterium]|jgi:hypothetical protein|nr:hypothetical protein [Deltaproteobacteria bacterium]